METQVPAIDMIELNPIEKTRVYSFPNGETVSLENVTHFAVSKSGTHRLKTGDGKMRIVPVGWHHIEIDAAEWTL